MILDWLSNALNKLTIDEFDKVTQRVMDLYNSSFKVIAVSRSENSKTKVTVRLDNGQMKLVAL